MLARITVMAIIMATIASSGSTLHSAKLLRSEFVKSVGLISVMRCLAGKIVDESALGAHRDLVDDDGSRFAAGVAGQSSDGLAGWTSVHGRLPGLSQLSFDVGDLLRRQRPKLCVIIEVKHGAWHATLLCGLWTAPAHPNSTTAKAAFAAPGRHVRHRLVRDRGADQNGVIIGVCHYPL
jgi:hypothetical protein